jgi:hypothetical protein
MQNQPSNVPTAKPKDPRLARRVAASFNKPVERMAAGLLFRRLWLRLAAAIAHFIR